MKQQRIALALATLGAALVLYAMFSRQSDEEKILENLARLEQVLSFTSAPNILARTASMNGEFKQLLALDARVSVPERRLAAGSRRDLAGLAARTTADFSAFEVMFEDIDIEVTEAAAEVEMRVVVEASLRSELRRDERLASLTYAEIDGDWLLVSAIVREPTDE